MKKAIHYLLRELVCIDKGDPNSSHYAGQTDLDGEDRLMGTYVDMGADEICPDCNDVYNPYDWNADGLVNMDEFVRFSRAWLAQSLLDPDYNAACDLDDDFDIDLADLQTFAPHWLWIACWRMDIWNYLEEVAASNQQTMAMSSASLESLETSQPVEIASVPSARTFSATSDVQPVEAVAGIETDPAAEREQVLSLLETVEEFISTGGEDAELWREMKNLLEQTLTETEDTEIETAEF